MKSIVTGVIFLLTGVGLAAPPPLRVSIVSHNEEPAARRQPDYLTNQAFYLSNREMVRQLALVVQSKGAKWNFQSDWNFLQAVARYDTATVMAATNGKNILRWMVEDLGFAADAHAHESKYNYADVAYLHKQLGLPDTGVVGGFIFSPPPDAAQSWERHEAGLRGVKFPGFFWRASLLWGAATGLHLGEDDESYGLWRPQDKDKFYVDDPSKRMVYIGGGCKSTFLDAAPYGVQAYLNAAAKGRLPEDGFYTATIMITQGQLSTAVIHSVRDQLEALRPHAAAGRIVYVKLGEALAQWTTSYGARAYRLGCEEMEALGR